MDPRNGPDRPAAPTTPKGASESEQAPFKEEEGQGQRRSFLGFFSEKAGSPPGVGRETHVAGPCAGPKQDHRRCSPPPLESRENPHEPLPAAVWQTTSLPYDKEANLARALRAMEAAHARGASLLVLPEMFLTGYLIRDRLEGLAEPVPDGPSLLVLRERPRPLPGPGGGPACGPPRRQALQRPGDDRPGRFRGRRPGENPLLRRGGEDVRPRPHPPGL